MQKNTILFKALAIFGTVLILLPILAPFIFALLRIIRSGQPIFMFDYLLPAEFFPVAFAGGILITIPSILTRSYRALIISSFAAAAAMLISGQIFAVATGLASGETEPTGWIWMVVIISLALYSVSLIIMGAGGILLSKKIINK